MATPITGLPAEDDPKYQIPSGLRNSAHLFTESQLSLATSLCSVDEGRQDHLFEEWTTKVDDDDRKRSFMEFLEKIDRSYADGGILGYLRNARNLLERSRCGFNPLDAWNPSVPVGQNVQLGTPEFEKYERMGLAEMGRCGFVLVAGGLGERLGYGDIKIGLPTELSTRTTYIQYYIETILAHQAKHVESACQLPLCIMTSGDTNAKTVDMLKQNKYFGMDESQITIVQQGDGVPALANNDAQMVLSERYEIMTKPHGHGDIHALLHTHGVAKRWLDDGIEWLVLFQDTNGLAFHTLPVSLGVSSELDLVMNSIAVPRKAKQAIGGIALLTNDASGEQKTLNVEYNQLDPMLRSTKNFPDGDVNDPSTGFSPFPGNINQLVFALEPYVETLELTGGLMPEFVNPKYADAEKTKFKKPTRLECMMQDFPTVLPAHLASNVGFTCLDASLSFSPVKNALSDGAALQSKGTAPGCAASGEADQYAATRIILQSLGCFVEDAEPVSYGGVSVVPGPQVVFHPQFATCASEVAEKITSPPSVRITSRSSLVVDKSCGNIVIESLHLDGALVLRCEEGASGTVRDLVVRNKGWITVPVEDGQKDVEEIILMRGYDLKNVETTVATVKVDGYIEIVKLQN